MLTEPCENILCGRSETSYLLGMVVLAGPDNKNYCLYGNMSKK
jgi:hypothetical protein